MRILVITLILGLFGINTPFQEPVQCSITESEQSDGMTKLEESRLITTLTCGDRIFDIPRTAYIFTGCTKVLLKRVNGDLVPVKNQPEKSCKIGHVEACQQAVKSKNRQYGQISFMNLNLEECQNVELTNVLFDGITQ